MIGSMIGQTIPSSNAPSGSADTEASTPAHVDERCTQRRKGQIGAFPDHYFHIRTPVAPSTAPSAAPKTPIAVALHSALTGCTGGITACWKHGGHVGHGVIPAGHGSAEAS